MYSNDEPKIGEERFLTHVDYDGNPSISKIKVVNRWADQDAGGMVNKVKVIDSLFGGWHAPLVLHIDYDWQLQKTLEDAKRVMFIGIFNSEKTGMTWLYREPPWE